MLNRILRRVASSTVIASKRTVGVVSLARTSTKAVASNAINKIEKKNIDSKLQKPQLSRSLTKTKIVVESKLEKETLPVAIPSHLANAMFFNNKSAGYPSSLALAKKIEQSAKIEAKLLKAVGENVRIHQGKITDSSGAKTNDCYILLQELRKDDVFPSTISKEKMIELFFPKNSSDLALSLSNATSAFYGIMLETCGKSIGFENVNKISKDFFYKLGRVKTKVTKESIAGQFEIPNDARGVVILLVSAIYNASPEYKFEIKQFNQDVCEISLRGIDRYYRITNLLGIKKHLQWPVLHTFMEGIKDELSADVDIKSEMISIKDTGECHERFLVKRR